MSRRERTFVRCAAYSRWHRTLDPDLDSVEYCPRCCGQTFKPAAVTQAVASAHQVPALCVLYLLDPRGLRDLHACQISKHAGGAA
jgi:hypothetical protein